MYEEQNVVQGVLAVQLGLASPRQVRDATLEMTPAETRLLSDTLVRKGILSAPQGEMVGRLGARALESQDGDLADTLQALGSDTILGRTLGSATPAQAGAASAEDDDPLLITFEQPGRYRIGGDAAGGDAAAAELGRGGIGRVLLAYDEHVGREVAIKELLPMAEVADARGGTSPAMARFLREARVTGQLEHPNVVPVYEVGRRRDGSLYYTMKVVRGRTLTEALKACASLEERLSLLPHFLDLCHAIAYAHSRGVIHRDVKPDNVMLGEFGETVVLDWGIAKVRGRRDLRGEEVQRSIRLFDEARAGKTSAGQLLGTPHFMSPEQAAGKVEAIDERSDVFGLGAVLYVLLTGGPPFAGTALPELLHRLLVGEIPSVAERCDEAPPELAAVCEKALAVYPDDRYADAHEMAAEVQAYLTGGRVGSYDYRLSELLKRFAARHKLPLLVAGVATVVLFVFALLAYLGVVAERDVARAAQTEAEQAHAVADTSRARAAAAHRRAESLVQYMLFDLHEKLEPVGRLDILEDVIAAVHRHYGDEGDPRDGESARNRAAADWLEARLLLAQGDVEAAERALRGALTAQAALVEREPHNVRWRTDLGRSLLWSGVVRAKRSDREGAVADFAAALAVFEGVAADAPDDDEVRLELSRTLLHQGEAVAATGGGLARAEEIFRRAFSIRKALVDADPERPKWQRGLAQAHQALGDVRLDQGDARGAELAYADALAITERLVAREPRNTRWRHDVSVLHDHLGELRGRSDDLPGAERHFLAAQGILEELVAADPSNVRWTRNLAVCHGRLGDLRIDAEQPERAHASYEAAVDIFHKLANHDPNNAQGTRDLAVTLGRLGDVELAAGATADAARSFSRSLSLLEALAERDPGDDSCQLDLALGHAKVADAALLGEEWERGRTSLESARAILDRLIVRDPDNAGWRRSHEQVVRQLATLTAAEDRHRQGLRLRTEPAEKRMLLRVRGAPTTRPPLRGRGEDDRSPEPGTDGL